MGRYKTEKIFYPNRWQRTEDLVADGFFYAQSKRSETIEIAAHIMAVAYGNKDDELYNAGLELMRVANSPCNFKADDSAEKATDNNNRPTEPYAPEIPKEFLEKTDMVEEEWNDCLDGIFDKKINPKMVKMAIAGMSSERLSGKRFYYVAYRILKIIRWIPASTTDADYLRWVNLHFDLGWIDDKQHKHQFQFNLEDSSKNLASKHPSKWTDDTVYGGRGRFYHELAIKFKNEFTQTIINGKPVDDSESFEHLKDRPQFLKGAKVYYGEYYVPDQAYINNGK